MLIWFANANNQACGRFSTGWLSRLGTEPALKCIELFLLPTLSPKRGRRHARTLGVRPAMALALYWFLPMILRFSCSSACTEFPERRPQELLGRCYT
jgi:hypothetical protein